MAVTKTIYLVTTIPLYKIGYQMPKRLCNKILSHKFLVTIFTSNVFETNHLREYLFIAGGDILAGTTPLNSDNTIYYSQKLDELITIYQKLKIDNIQKVDQKSCIAI